MQNRDPLLHTMPELAVQTALLGEALSVSGEDKDILIIYVLHGAVTVAGATRQLFLGEHEFMLIHPREDVRLKPGKGAHAALFRFPQELLAVLDHREEVVLSGCSVLERKDADDGLRDILTGMLQNRIKNLKGRPAVELRWTFELLCYLLSHYSAEPPKGSGRHPNKPNQRLRDICDYMQAHFKQPLTLTEAADLHYVSVPYLSKSFKKETGMTFSEYLNRVRMCHAMLYLLYTEQPITRIALDSGFPSLTAFNRVFREMYQLTPSLYRKAAHASVMDAAQSTAGGSGEMEEWLALEALLSGREHGAAAVTVVRADEESLRNDKRAWKELINIGYARDLLNSDLQEQLPLLRHELGFSYARFWGIFSDEMMIEDPLDAGFGYNFNNADKVLDTLLRNHLKPYIELGDKPRLIQKNISERMGAAPSPPKRRDGGEWQRLIRAFLIHCTNRYGSEEVESWYFELWHSSKHAFLPEELELLAGQGYEQEEMERWFDAYFERFDQTWNEIKQVLPGARLGGCGLSMDLEGKHLPLLLERWSRRSIRPDFLSVYLYPYEFTTPAAGGAPVFVHSPDEAWMVHTLQSIRHSLNEHQLQHLPLHVSEWNFSISNRDFLNDSIFKAAYILKNMAGVLDENCLMGYWLYSDIFSELRDSRRLLHGGAGLISKNGIKKPAFYAFAFLNRMGRQLIGKGRDYLLTKRSGERYQLLCFCYRHFEPDRRRNAEPAISPEMPEDAGEPGKAQLRRFRLEGLKDGSYRLKRSFLGSERGAILQEWSRFGGIHDIRPDEIGFLKQICVPYISVEHVEVRNGILEIGSALRPHEVSLIELELRMNLN